MLDDLTTRDQRMMFAVVTLVHLADSKEELDLSLIHISIRPDAADGDDVLYRSRNRKYFFVLLQCILQSFNQV